MILLLNPDGPDAEPSRGSFPAASEAGLAAADCAACGAAPLRSGWRCC